MMSGEGMKGFHADSAGDFPQDSADRGLNESQDCSTKLIYGPGDISATEAEIECALSVLDRAASIPGHVVQALRQVYFNHISRTNGKSGDYSHGNRSSDGQANSKRLRMTKQQAIEIYCQRPNAGVDDKLRRGSMSGCKDLAIKYGVTPKTIRDIWLVSFEVAAHPVACRPSCTCSNLDNPCTCSNPDRELRHNIN